MKRFALQTTLILGFVLSLQPSAEAQPTLSAAVSVRQVKSLNKVCAKAFTRFAKLSSRIEAGDEISDERLSAVLATLAECGGKALEVADASDSAIKDLLAQEVKEGDESSADSNESPPSPPEFPSTSSAEGFATIAPTATSIPPTIVPTLAVTTIANNPPTIVPTISVPTIQPPAATSVPPMPTIVVNPPPTTTTAPPMPTFAYSPPPTFTYNPPVVPTYVVTTTVTGGDGGGVGGNT